MPYPNEHACRLRSPGDFQSASFRRTTRRSGGKAYDVIMARPQGASGMAEQAYRYPIGSWTAAEARAHCHEHGGSFEAAAPEE